MPEPGNDNASPSVEIGMTIVGGCLVVPVQVELHDETLPRIRTDILDRIQAAAVRAVVIDLSGVRVLDALAFEELAVTARMVSLLGATTVLAGIQPGAASALVDLDVDLKSIRTARTLEDALTQLKPIVWPQAVADPKDATLNQQPAVEEPASDGAERAL